MAAPLPSDCGHAPDYRPAPTAQQPGRLAPPGAPSTQALARGPYRRAPSRPQREPYPRLVSCPVAGHRPQQGQGGWGLDPTPLSSNISTAWQHTADHHLWPPDSKYYAHHPYHNTHATARKGTASGRTQAPPSELWGRKLPSERLARYRQSTGPSSSPTAGLVRRGSAYSPLGIWGR